MPSPREAIDGKHARERLEHAPRLEEAEPSAEAARRVLESRAAALAKPLPEATAPGETLPLLVFSRGEESYAVDANSVVGVFPFVDSTEVPFTPPVVLGVVNHRGRILPVLDLSGVLQASRAEAEPRLVIAAEAGDAAFGIGADSVSGVISVATREILPGSESDEQPDGLVRGVTRSLAAVLDLDALVRDSRVEVNDEIE